MKQLRRALWKKVRSVVRQQLISMLMAAMVIGGTTDDGNNSSKYVSAKNWMTTKEVKAAEKQLGCLSVEIKLYKKTKYNLGKRSVKTDKVIGLVRFEQLNKDILMIYDSKGKVLATVREENIKEILGYNDGKLIYTFTRVIETLPDKDKETEEYTREILDYK